MYNGILVLDKPEDFTSHDVIAKLRGMLKMRKMGHSGTLDPKATGILPIFLGNATKAVDFHMNTEKEYVATLKFGIKTDTEDIWGEVLETAEICIKKEQILAVLPKFIGEIMQVPPMYSAIKINGQRLYDIARNGGTVERKARKVDIYNIELIEENLLENEFKIRILCGKGTYIRTIITDIAHELGTIATMTSLVRTKSGGYKKGLTLDEVQKLSDSGEIEKYIQPTDSVFSDYLSVKVDETGEIRLRNGTFSRDENVSCMPLENNISVAVYNEKEEFFMLGETKKLYDGGRAIFPIKAFF